jgi:hypothetical protein
MLLTLLDRDSVIVPQEQCSPVALLQAGSIVFRKKTIGCYVGCCVFLLGRRNEFCSEVSRFLHFTSDSES